MQAIDVLASPLGRRGGVFSNITHFWDSASVREIIYNAIEHGSQFGENGPVQVRCVAGQEASLYVVEDPGQGKIDLPLHPEVILDRLNLQGQSLEPSSRDYAGIVTARVKRKEPILFRKKGGIVLSLSKAWINTQVLESGYRAIVLYDTKSIPDFWPGIPLPQSL